MRYTIHRMKSAASLPINFPCLLSVWWQYQSHYAGPDWRYQSVSSHWRMQCQHSAVLFQERLLRLVSHFPFRPSALWCNHPVISLVFPKQLFQSLWHWYDSVLLFDRLLHPLQVSWSWLHLYHPKIFPSGWWRQSMISGLPDRSSWTCQSVHIFSLRPRRVLSCRKTWNQTHRTQ